MIIKKKDLSIQEVQDIQNTLDIIDVSIYDLIIKRKELKARLENQKQPSVYNMLKNLSLSIQKITEQRKLDKSAISQTASFLNALDFSNSNITIASLSKNNNENYSNLSNIFPFLKEIRHLGFEKQTEIISNILTYPNMIGIIPALKTNPKDVWWMPLMSSENANIKIIAKTPFLNFDSELKEDYLIAKTGSFYGFDRSIIVIATSETTNSSWLKTALHKINVPLYNIIDSTAIFNGTVLHLIEISDRVLSKDDRIFRLDEILNGINIRFAGYLGGYFLPIVQKDKIIKFKKDLY